MTGPATGPVTRPAARRPSPWVPLTGAITSEVSATLALRAAVDQPAWYALTVVGYLVAFGLLARTLEVGMPVGVAYAVWAATGVAATAVLAALLFGERLSPLAGFGIVLIVVGVVVVELGSHRAGQRR